MSFKLNQLELTPDYDAYKNFSISVGKDYQTQVISGGFPISQVHSGQVDKVSISFPLACSTASAGVNLQNQVRELAKNVDVSEVYLNWSAATHLNGYYTLEDADIKIPTGGITGGFAEFGAKLSRIGQKEQVQSALQLNKASRAHAYGTMVTAQSLHGFPCGASVFSTSGTFYNRSGSEGSVGVAQNAGSQDLFPYEQEEGSIGKGDVRVYDDMGASGTRANWVEVFGPDHKFTGDIVLENGLIQVLSRKEFGTYVPGGLSLKYFDGTSYTSTGTCAFLEEDGVNHGGVVPKVSMNKVSPEESEALLSFPPSGNSLKVRVKLKRGRFDVEAKPCFITGSVHANFVTEMYITPSLDYAEADGTYSGGTVSGSYSVAMASKNYIVAYNNATQFFQGMARTATRTNPSRFYVSGSKVYTFGMATGSDWMSLFAVKPPTGKDTPADLGAQLLMDAKALPQVIQR